MSVNGKFRYAMIFVDEHSRYVFIAFLRDKSEVMEATRLVIAKFNALVGTPVDDNGRPLARPKVAQH